MTTLRELSESLSEQMLDESIAEVDSILEARGFVIEAETLDDYIEGIQEALTADELSEEDKRRLDELLAGFANVAGRAIGGVSGAANAVGRAGRFVGRGVKKAGSFVKKDVSKFGQQMKQAYQSGHTASRTALGATAKYGQQAPSAPAAASPSPSTAAPAATAGSAAAAATEPKIRKRDNQPAGTPSAPGQGKRGLQKQQQQGAGAPSAPQPGQIPGRKCRTVCDG